MLLSSPKTLMKSLAPGPLISPKKNHRNNDCKMNNYVKKNSKSLSSSSGLW